MARVLGKAQVLRLQIDGVDNSGKAFQSANRRMGKLQKTASGLTGVVGGLRYGFAAVAGSLALRQWGEAIDTYQRAANRLSLVTNSTRELADVQRELYGLAQETRQDFGATVQFYSRMALAAEKLKLNQQELIGITETVGKLVAISGSSAAEASGGLIQFSQGLASGRFQGEELRSVMENIPALARAIAGNLKNVDGSIGVSLGQFRELAKEGKLTPQAILDALKRARADTEQRYEGMTITIGQAWEKLSNSVERMFAEDSGLGQAVAQGINWFSEFVDVITEASNATRDFFALDIKVKGNEALDALITKTRADIANIKDDLATETQPLLITNLEHALAGAERRLAALTNQRWAGVGFDDFATGGAAAASSKSGKVGDDSELSQQEIDNAKERQDALAAAELAQQATVAGIRDAARIANADAYAAAGVAAAEARAAQHEREYEDELAHRTMIAQLADDARVREAEAAAAADVAKFEREAAERDRDLAAWEEYYGIRLNIAEDYYNAEGRLAAIKEAAMQDAAKAGGELLSFLATRSKTAFKINKAVAIAEAVINTHKGITKALELPFPANLAAAAATGARGFVSVAKIKATNYGGGGGGDSGGAATGANGSVSTATPAALGGAGGFAAAAPAPARPIIIEMPSGGSLLSTEQLSQLITELSDAAGDGLDIKARVL